MEEMDREKPGQGKGIYQAMASVMAQIPAIGKEQEMRAGNVKYNFRGIDDVYNALQPLLAKEGIFVLPHCVDRMQNTDGRCIRVLVRMRYAFCHCDGSSLSCEVVGEALDTSDKATNKAMSIAMKYALFQTFCIPTRDMTDPDAEFIEAVPEAKGKTEPEQKGKAGRDERKSRREENVGQEFFEAFRVSIRENPRWFFGDVSEFLGRRVSAISDMSDGEMRSYMRAALSD